MRNEGWINPESMQLTFEQQFKLKTYCMEIENCQDVTELKELLKQAVQYTMRLENINREMLKMIAEIK